MTASTQQSSTGGPDRSALATILVVEDEDALRRLIVRMLSRMGYATLEAADGEEGAKVAGTADGLDLILSDVVMPRLNGPDMAERLREDGVSVPVAFMSGYSGEALAGADQHTHFLAKPFTMDELRTFVAGVLGRD